jgi:hypothetical protein
MELWNMNRAIDVRDVLPVLRTPSLVLHSKHDRVIDVAHGRRLAEQIHGARYVEIEAVDHLPVSPPAAATVLEAIFEWLDRPSLEPAARRRLATLLLCASDTEPPRPMDEAIDQLLLAHGGRRVDAGRPECSALFDGPVAAARCARALIAGLRRQGGEARLAFHCGEFECLEPAQGDAASASMQAPRMRVLGPAVGVTVDLLERAGSGEVLTSSVVIDLSMGSGLEFVPVDGELSNGAGGSIAVYALG